MKIAVITNRERDRDLHYTGMICSSLCRLGAEVLVPDDIAGIQNDGMTATEISAIYQDSDVIIALGGDGTILHTAKYAALRQIPVMGVNIGRLGYLAAIEANELDSLEKLLNGDYQIDSRMMLKVVIKHTDAQKSYLALNDAVISKGALSRIIDIGVSCNGRRVGNYRADGIIISTPTGSTAYALSAGGPVIDPVLESVGVIPICPHSLVSRSLLFSPESLIGVKTGKMEDKDAFLTIDGQEFVSLEGGDQILVTRADIQAKLIRLKDSTFYEVIHKKLSERGI